MKAPAALRRVRNAWRALVAPAKRDGGYKGAQVSRLVADWVAGIRKADQEVKRDARLLRARARQLSRDVSAIRYFRQLLATNVIGPRGPKLQAQVELAGTDGELDKKTNRTIEKAWAKWSRSRVSSDGKLTFVELQKLAVKTIATDGEILIRHVVDPSVPFGYAIQLIDADQLDDTLIRQRGPEGNEIRMGVEIDLRGRAVAYHLLDSPGMYDGMPSKRIRVPADEIEHLYVSERANQTRGVTWFTTAMFPLNMLDGYSEAELVAARTAAAKMGFFVPNENAIGGELGKEDSDGAPPTMEANPGDLGVVPAGYKGFEAWDPQHPTTAYPDFVKAIRRDVACGLGASYNSLFNDLEGVNFSSMRQGLLTERDLWKGIQWWWICSFLHAVYARWLDAALLSGALTLASRDASRYEDVTFMARGWDWVDPLKDVQAGAEEIAAGLGSRSRILAERGEDLEETFAQLAAEEDLAKEYGIDVTPVTAGAAGAAAAANQPDTTTNGDGTTQDQQNGSNKGRAQLIALHRRR